MIHLSSSSANWHDSLPAGALINDTFRRNFERTCMSPNVFAYVFALSLSVISYAFLRRDLAAVACLRHSFMPLSLR